MKKLTLILFILTLNGCGLLSSSAVNSRLYTWKIDFPYTIKADDQLITDGLIIKSKDGSLLSIHSESIREKPQQLSSEDFFRRLFGHYEGRESEVLAARHLVFDAVIKHRELSKDNLVTFYFKYADGLEKIALLDLKSTDYYLVLETRDNNLLAIYNSIRRQ